MAQGERMQRSARRRAAGRVNSHQLPLRGRIICGICGRTMKMVVFPDGRIQWRCRKRAAVKKTDWKENRPGCPNRYMDDWRLRQLLTRALYMLPEHRQDISDLSSENSSEEICRAAEYMKRFEAAEESREAYLEKISGYASMAAYIQSGMNRRLLDKISDYLMGVHSPVSDSGKECRDSKQFLDLTDELKDLPSEEEGMDDRWIRRLLDHVVVYQDSLETLWKGRIRVEVHEHWRAQPKGRLTAH